MSSETPARTLVIGIGNLLQSDDGLGVQAALMLEKENLPEDVQVEELGTPGWGLLAQMEGRSRIYVIDAVHMGLEPGAWQRISGDRVRLVSEAGAVSLHETGLAESLELADTLGIMPDKFVLYGVEPAVIEPGEGLSPAVQEALPELVENIVKDLWKGA